MQTGYLTLGRVRGALVRMHWSAFALALLLGYSRHGSIWTSLLGSFFVLALIVVHEFGHAFMVWRYRHTVHSLDVFAFHGWCRWSGRPSPYERAMIAWGGVFAQLVLLGVALPIMLLVDQRGIALSAMVHVFVWTNLYLIGINLIPIAPLDGAEAWKLLPLLKQRGPRQFHMDDQPPKRGSDRGRPRRQPRAQRKSRPPLRLLTPPPGDTPPVSESSQKIADDVIRDAIERSRRKFEDPDTNDD
ncbi:MAG: stage IV sporulation protein FB [Bradymonadia bacterium]|jgi:stage IV sporulation protein FB